MQRQMPNAGQSPSAAVRDLFGDIDIYLFDQLARGRLDHRHRVLDAGCGAGRNLRYFLAHDYDCHGIDRDSSAIAQLRGEAQSLGRGDADERFIVGDVEALPWSDQSFDAVISSAVLHFADDQRHFDQMVAEMWRVLAPDGLLFARLASTIGLEGFGARAGQRVRLPDGSDRFVVDEAMLLESTAKLGGRLADPLKTTNVQNQRAMTTWCILKGNAP
jgi:ubiquinone/menaquinone biosynthesis C-methylase UbiE